MSAFLNLVDLPPLPEAPSVETMYPDVWKIHLSCGICGSECSVRYDQRNAAGTEYSVWEQQCTGPGEHADRLIADARDVFENWCTSQDAPMDYSPSFAEQLDAARRLK